MNKKAALIKNARFDALKYMGGGTAIGAGLGLGVGALRNRNIDPNDPEAEDKKRENLRQGLTGGAVAGLAAGTGAAYLIPKHYQNKSMKLIHSKNQDMNKQLADHANKREHMNWFGKMIHPSEERLKSKLQNDQPYVKQRVSDAIEKQRASGVSWPSGKSEGSIKKNIQKEYKQVPNLLASMKGFSSDAKNKYKYIEGLYK